MTILSLDYRERVKSLSVTVDRWLIECYDTVTVYTERGARELIWMGCVRGRGIKVCTHSHVAHCQSDTGLSNDVLIYSYPLSKKGCTFLKPPQV